MVGALTIAVVCAIQALVLGDGGITTLGLDDHQPRARPGVRRLSAAARAPRESVPVRVAAAGTVAAVCVLLAATIFLAEIEFGAAVRHRPHRDRRLDLGSYAVIAAIEGRAHVR